MIPFVAFALLALFAVAAGSARGASRRRGRLLPREALAVLSANSTPDGLRTFARIVKGSGFEAISALAETVADLREEKTDLGAGRAVQVPGWVVERLERLQLNPFALADGELEDLEFWFRQNGLVAQADMLKQLRWVRAGGVLGSVLGGLVALILGTAPRGLTPYTAILDPRRGPVTLYRGTFLFLLFPPSFFPPEHEGPEA